MTTLSARRLAFLVAANTALAPLAIDAYLPAMPSLAASIGASVHHTELSLSVFLFGFALGQLICGPLSDRFGLWLGFHACDQTTYLDMIQGYVEHYHLNIDAQTLRAEAIEWSVTRGGRSGRVAWQYIQDLAGRLGKKLIT